MNTPQSEIKAWLRSIGKDREWLAEQLKTKKSVVDSWFSKRGFPEDRLNAIRQIMEPADDTSLIRVPFTDEQFHKTQKAAKIVHSEFQEYCQRAIAAQVEHDLEETKLKVAEDSAEYKTEKKNP